MKLLHLINPQAVEQYVKEVFIAAGLNEEESAETAGHLITANLRGVDSHGLQRVSTYVERLNRGLIAGNVTIHVERDTPVSALVNGNNGIGQYIAKQALELGMIKARQNGVGIIGMHNANHTGMLAYYTEWAARNDLIVFATTNAPSNMAPFGGKRKYFGTNPFSFAFPAGEEAPFVLDMATSVVAKGKIILAMKNNKPIPVGWAIDKQGAPTTDAREAYEGLVLPLGGPKGYGLAFMVDIFSGVLTGANWGPHIGDLYFNFDSPQNLGQFFYIMRPDLFIEMSQYKQRMDQAIREVRAVEKADGVERIYIPGEIESELRNKRLAEGIPLTDEIIDELRRAGESVGIKRDLLSPEFQMS